MNYESQLLTIPERSPHRAHLLGLVSELSNLLVDGANSSEDARRLSDNSFRALKDSGLFASLVPSCVGGFQVDPITELELIEAISALDGSTGWSFWILAGSTARVASMLPQECLVDVLCDRSGFPLFAFQEKPFGNTANATKDGLRLTGRWPFGTGVAHAQWVVAVATLSTDSGCEPPWPDAKIVAAAIPTSQIQIIDTWDAAGLAGTGTFDYAVEDLLIPWHRVWPYPPKAPIRGGIHFAFRRAPIKHMGFALGVAKNSLLAFIAHLKQRSHSAARAPIGADLARAQHALDAARMLALYTVGDIWAEIALIGEVVEKSQIRLQSVARYVTEIAIDVCNLVTRYGDATLLARQHPLQRNLRDISVAALHGEVNHGTLITHGFNLILEGKSAA